MWSVDRTLTSFTSGFSRTVAFSRSIAKLSKLSNRGQRVYNTKVTNRGGGLRTRMRERERERERGVKWREGEERDRRVGASMSIRAAI